MLTGQDKPLITIENYFAKPEPTHVTFVDELKKLDEKPTSILKELKVYTASRALPMQPVNLHGFPVVAGDIPSIKVSEECLLAIQKTKKTSKSFARVFNYGESGVDYAPYVLTKVVVDKIAAASNYSDEFKNMLKRLQGETYLSRAHFVNTLIHKIKNIDEKDSSQRDEIYFMGLHPRAFYSTMIKQARAVNRLKYVSLFRKVAYKINSKKNVNPERLNFFNRRVEYVNTLLRDVDLARHLTNLQCDNPTPAHFVPLLGTERYSTNDRIAFEKSECEKIELACIHPTSVYETVDLHRRCDAYLNEKLLSVSPKKLEKIREKLSYFSIILFQKENSTNCNKATASLLEAAADHSQFYQLTRGHDRPVSISGASYFSVGSTSRMYFWGSLFPKIVEQLFNQTDLVYLKKPETMTNNLLQYLIDNKELIYKEILAWPAEKKILVLQHILDPRTSLGKVFYGQRSGHLSKPHITGGMLVLAQKELDTMKSMVIPSSVRPKDTFETYTSLQKYLAHYPNHKLLHYTKPLPGMNGNMCRVIAIANVLHYYNEVKVISCELPVMRKRPDNNTTKPYDAKPPVSLRQIAKQSSGSKIGEFYTGEMIAKFVTRIGDHLGNEQLKKANVLFKRLDAAKDYMDFIKSEIDNHRAPVVFFDVNVESPTEYGQPSQTEKGNREHGAAVIGYFERDTKLCFVLVQMGVYIVVNGLELSSAAANLFECRTVPKSFYKIKSISHTTRWCADVKAFSKNYSAIMPDITKAAEAKEFKSIDKKGDEKEDITLSDGSFVTLFRRKGFVNQEQKPGFKSTICVIVPKI